MRKIYAQKNRGFTLVEMLVSIALFSIVLIVTLGSIMTIVDVNRKSQSLTIVMNDLNFALENITRAVKTGDVDVNMSGNGVELHVIENFNDTTRNVVFRFEDKKITKQIGSGVPVAITSEQISIEKAKFTVFGTTSSGDSRQPRVLISIEGTAMVGPTISSKFNIQTTVSQRNLELGNANF